MFTFVLSIKNKIVDNIETIVLKQKSNTKKMNNLTNKVAVVTGGNSGIGYAAAKELIAQGANVVITGRNRDAVNKAAEELGATGIVSDQSKIDQIDQLAEAVKDQFGKV